MKSWRNTNAIAETLWKWTLRLVGLGAFVYILLVKNGNVPAASYVLVGGLIGLPNVINWQATLSRKDKPGSEREFRWKK